MSKLLQITFCNPDGSSEAAQKAAWERAQQIADCPGLIWKIWMTDPLRSLYGGLYLFEDEASTNAYLEGPIVEGIQAIPGVSNFEAHLFEVNSPLTTVTRGPVPANQTDT